MGSEGGQLANLATFATSPAKPLRSRRLLTGRLLWALVPTCPLNYVAAPDAEALSHVGYRLYDFRALSDRARTARIARRRQSAIKGLEVADARPECLRDYGTEASGTTLCY